MIIINNNITDFNLIEFNPKPYGPSTDKNFAVVLFDNGYRVDIHAYNPRTADDLEYIGTFTLQVTKEPDIQYGYNRLTESEITAKLIEIQSL